MENHRRTKHVWFLKAFFFVHRTNDFTAVLIRLRPTRLKCRRNKHVHRDTPLFPLVLRWPYEKYRSLLWPRHLHLHSQTRHALFRQVLCEHRHTMTHTDTFNDVTRSLFRQKLHTHSTFSNYGVIRCLRFPPPLLSWDLYQRCTRHHFSQPQCLPLCLLMAGMECLSTPLVPTGK